MVYPSTPAGISVSSPRTGSDVSQHEKAGDLWVLNTDTDTTEEDILLPGHSHVHRSPRLNASHDTTFAVGNVSRDQTLKPCQPSNHTLALQSDTSCEEAHSDSAWTGLDSLPHLPNLLAVNDFAQWLDSTRSVHGASPHSFTPKSPDAPKDRLHPSLDGAVFDFVSSSLDMSPLSLDSCDFGIEMFTGSDQTPHHRPTPHPINLQMDIRSSLDLFDSEEEGIDQQGGQDSLVTMATPWSSYFDRESPFGSQDGGKHPSTQSNGITKQHVSNFGVQDEGTYLNAVSNRSAHTANTADISQGAETQRRDLQMSSLVNDPEDRADNLYGDRADNLYGDRDIEVTRPIGPLHRLNYLSTRGQCTRGYEGEPEKSYFSHEEPDMGHQNGYNPISDTQDQGYNYYEIRSSCNSRKDQAEVMSTDLSSLPGEAFWVDDTNGATEAFWVDENKGATKPTPGTQATMLAELLQESQFMFSQSGGDVSLQRDYMADCAEVLSGLSSIVPGDVFQPQYTTIEASAACIQVVNSQLRRSGTSAQPSISSTDCPHRSTTGVQSSCLQNDHASLWSSGSSPQCSTPFMGVALSFPAPAQRPRLCQIATPPLGDDLLFDDIMEEEMSVNLIGGSCSFN